MSCSHVLERSELLHVVFKSRKCSPFVLQALLSNYAGGFMWAVKFTSSRFQYNLIAC